MKGGWGGGAGRVGRPRAALQHPHLGVHGALRLTLELGAAMQLQGPHAATVLDREVIAELRLLGFPLAFGPNQSMSTRMPSPVCCCFVAGSCSCHVQSHRQTARQTPSLQP